jgi:toxin ParE1/3/4
MGRLLFDPDAENDLRQIIHYIGVEQMRPETAREVAARIRRKCQKHADHPLLGELRNDLFSGMRLFSVPPFVVFYFPVDDGIRVARIIHGARDYPLLFS